MARRLECIVTWATAIVLTILSVRAMYVRGGPYFAMPATIESHTWVGPNDTPDAIALAIQARRFMKRGRTVTVIRPSQAPNYAATLFLASVGNLPLHRVIAPRFDRDSELPDYVLTVGERFEHPAYRLHASFPEGFLYHRQ